MSRYVVMQRGSDSEGAEFIRDGFSLPALIVPHLWLLFHRQWLAAVAVIDVMVLGTWAALKIDTPMLALGADILISIYVAIEGATLRIANLERNGWHETSVVEADHIKEAEIRYFVDLPQEPSLAISVIATAPNFTGSNAFAFPARG